MSSESSGKGKSETKQHHKGTALCRHFQLYYIAQIVFEPCVMREVFLTPGTTLGYVFTSAYRTLVSAPRLRKYVWQFFATISFLVLFSLSAQKVNRENDMLSFWIARLCFKRLVWYAECWAWVPTDPWPVMNSQGAFRHSLILSSPSGKW